MSTYSKFKFLEKKIVKKYKDENASALSLSERYDVPYSALIKHLRNKGVFRNNNELVLDEQQIRKDHLAGMSLRAIAKKHNCSYETIRKRLNRIGILVPRRKSSARKFATEIGHEYSKENKSITFLAEKYGCSVCVISSILDELKITKRPHRYDNNVRRAAVILSKKHTINETAKKLGIHPNTVFYILKERRKYNVEETINK